MNQFFQLAHVVSETDFPKQAIDGSIESSWAAHQLYTTANFGKKNLPLSWFVGGLNFQIEHHLFPNICHVHYPRISPIMKSTAEEYGIPYHCQGSFGNAVYEHFKLLWLLGKYDELPDTKSKAYA